jgi:hypothetical protein
MLLFKTILIAILLIYVAVCGVVFIYRRPQYIVWLGHTIAILMFFLLTGYFFGAKTMTMLILLYAILISVLTFVLRKLSKSIIDYSLFDNDSFSFDYKRYSNSVSRINIENEKQNHLTKLSRVFLCAFVPLWLIGFLTVKTFNSAFNCGNYFYPLTFSVKNKRTVFFLNIQAA